MVKPTQVQTCVQLRGGTDTQLSEIQAFDVRLGELERNVRSMVRELRMTCVV
jgi:hypothetical protein